MKVKQKIDLGDQTMIVLNWNLDKVKIKMMLKGYSQDQVDDLETEYKRFLILVIQHSKHLPISAPVDEMWHTHILFTKDYAKFGETLGEFIHHEPVTTEKRQQKINSAFKETLRLYERRWGKPNPIYWPENSCVCDPEGEGTDDTGGQW